LALAHISTNGSRGFKALNLAQHWFHQTKKDTEASIHPSYKQALIMRLSPVLLFTFFVSASAGKRAADKVSVAPDTCGGAANQNGGSRQRRALSAQEEVKRRRMQATK
jgi:hypothetical protein